MNIDLLKKYWKANTPPFHWWKGIALTIAGLLALTILAVVVLYGAFQLYLSFTS